jgi:hypothetical protein
VSRYAHLTHTDTTHDDTKEHRDYLATRSAPGRALVIDISSHQAGSIPTTQRLMTHCDHTNIEPHVIVAVRLDSHAPESQGVCEKTDAEENSIAEAHFPPFLDPNLRHQHKGKPVITQFTMMWNILTLIPS